jgi:hypothetical protein
VRANSIAPFCWMSAPSSVGGVASWIAIPTQTWRRPDYINQHFVSIKVDFDSAPELVAELQRAQAVIAALPGVLMQMPDKPRRSHNYPSGAS